jgi:hypothetical protein
MGQRAILSPVPRHIAVSVFGFEDCQFSIPLIPVTSDLNDDLRRNGVTQRIE